MSLLPAGYKRLEYIESNGTQHIDSGFKPNNNTRVVMDFKPTEAYSSMNAYFGARDTSTSSTAPNQYVLWNNGAKSLRSDYFKTNVSLTIENLQTRKISDKNKNVTTVDGVTATNTANTGQCSYNMLLFAVNNAGTPDFKTKIQLYSCKIYDNGTLVRNFFPCENASGAVGLYDTVGGAFYDNDGTGTFVAGPEFWYDELEYIESSGTQYVDTGFIPNQDSRVDITAMRLDSSTSSFIPYGAAESYQSNAFECYDYGSQLEFNYDGQYNTTIGSSTVGEVVILSHDKNKISVNGELLHTFTYTSFTAPYTLILFGIHRATSVYGKARIYSCQIYDNGTLIRDYVPARTSGGSVGLIDKLTDEFYPNMGTGVFTAGRLKPKKYMELEYIESTGTQYVDTGFKPNQDTVLDFDMTLTGTPSSDWPFGVRKASAVDCYALMATNATSLTSWHGSNSKVATVPTLLTRFRIRREGAITSLVYSDGTVSAIANLASEFQSGYNLFLLNINLAGTPANACVMAKVYSCKIYDNGTTVRDYIPVKLNDGTVGLLDKVSGLFYGNAGTGTFVAGPGVETPPAQQIPPTPQNLHVSYAYGSSIRIEWEEAVDAEYYNVYRDGVLASQVTTTSYTDSGLAERAEHTYAVSAVNSLGESESTSITAILTEFKLITDRSAADVQYVSGLALKAHKMTDAELAEWLSGLKGAYNASDLNRVEGAVLYVIERLQTAGWYVKLETKTGWKFSDFPTVAEMDRYLSNIRKLRAALPTGLPVVPADADRLTYNEANDIELLLEMLDAAVTNIMANVFYINELYSGEVQ